MTVTNQQFLSMDSLPYGDGSNKIYGMENFGNTCYCNSILQCLFYTEDFRKQLLMHNNKPHGRRTNVPGIKAHGFTTKYEQLVAKKLREQGKPGSFSNGSSMNNGNGFSNGAVNNIPSKDRSVSNGSGASNGSMGPPTNTASNVPPLSHPAGATTNTSSLPVPPGPPVKRNSLFGIKFGSNANKETAPATTSQTGNGWEAMQKNSVLDANHCEELSVEQQILIKKNTEMQHLQILVTRPPSQAANAEKLDYSQASSNLLSTTTAAANDNKGANSSTTNSAIPTINANANGGVSTKSFVVVGIPYPDPLTNYNPNPTSDQRKRAALIKGPILNLDCSLQLPSEQHEQSSLLYALRDIYEAMIENTSQIGVTSPNWFINKLKEKNYLFRQNNMHHDAHEFANYLINDIIECLDHEIKGQRESPQPGEAPIVNWCNNIFKGSITNETKCLSCETITSKEESFLDLSVDIPPGESAYSLTHSLNNFSKSERLTHQNKFYCNTCSSLQEATKTIKIKKVPEVLIINLKRFKYDEKVDRMVKLFDSISYSHKLRLFNIKETGSNGAHSHSHHQTGDDFTLFELYALVVHIGGGPMHGHYVALCKVKAKLWLLFDDETVELVDDSYVLRFFGDGPGLASAYILFYRKCHTETEGYDDTEEVAAGTAEEQDEDAVDFGFNLTEMYHGGDYSLASKAPGKDSQYQHSNGSDGNSNEDNANGGDKLSVASSSLSGTDTLDGLQPSNTKEKEAGISRKATGLFKKNFRLDNFAEEGTTTISRTTSNVAADAKSKTANAPPAVKPAEKKSWVGGLKRRESKVENFRPSPERKDSVVSESSVDAVSRRKSIFGFKKKSKD